MVSHGRSRPFTVGQKTETMRTARCEGSDRHDQYRRQWKQQAVLGAAAKTTPNRRDRWCWHRFPLNQSALRRSATEPRPSALRAFSQGAWISPAVPPDYAGARLIGKHRVVGSPFRTDCWTAPGTAYWLRAPVSAMPPSGS